MLEKIIAIILGVAIFVGILALSFVLTSAIIYGICWAFKLTFAWRYAFGIWLILLLVGGIFERGGKND
jgi:hypothetical protein